MLVAARQQIVALAAAILLHEGNGRHRGRVDLGRIVAVPIFARGDEGVVRMGEGDGHEEGPLVLIARQVEQLAVGGVGNFLIIVELEAARAQPGLHHAEQAHPRAGKGRVGLPIRCPGEVGGVDVGGDPLLIAMQLVGTDEVHLAGQDGAIALQPQVMHQRGRRGGEVRAIVEGADAAGPLPRQHGGARGRADREVAIGIAEHRAARAERVDMRRLRHLVAIGGQHARCQLIRHDQQDIGSAHGALLRYGISTIFAAATAPASMAATAAAPSDSGRISSQSSAPKRPATSSFTTVRNSTGV